MKRHLQNLLEIYLCVAFFVYNTVFLVFFWDVPSLLWRFSAFDVLGFLSYQLTFALLGSALATSIITGVVYLLPLPQIKNNRSASGALFALSLAISSLIFKQNEQIRQWLNGASTITNVHASQIVTFLWLFTACGLPLISMLIVKNKKVVRRIKSAVENLWILTGLYTLMSFIGILVVIYRNLP